MIACRTDPTPSPSLRRPGLVVAVWVLAAFLTSQNANAQITPDRSCITIDKPIWITVRTPDDARASSAASSKPARARLLLLDELLPPKPGAGTDVTSGPGSTASTEIEPSRDKESTRVNLARTFPVLWSAPSLRPRFIQLEVDGKRVGPALVLVPMVPPSYAPRVDRTGLPVFVKSGEPAKAMSGYWLFTEKDALVTTDAGTVRLRLRADLAPRSVIAFRSLVERGFYDDTPVLRIASLRARPEPDILQFGDPTGTGLGGPGIFVDLEDSALRHDYGTLSFARSNDPNSASSQVVITLSREGAATLQSRYAAFGQVVGESSVKTLSRLAKSPVDAEGRPKPAVAIQRIELVDAVPLGMGEQPAKDPSAVPAGGR